MAGCSRTIHQGIELIMGLKRNIRKFFTVLKQYGLKTVIMKVKHHIVLTRNMYGLFPRLQIRKQVRFPNRKQTAYERSYKFSKDIKVSILTPVYNTNEKELRAMLNSVINQTYENWELCLGDGSDANHGYVGKICKEYAAKDSRIKYLAIENGGIAKNTNTCADMATGSFIGLLDHDDILHPSALFEAVKCICEEGADFIYSDEAKFEKRVSDSFLLHIKSDFGPDTILGNNYICHFSCFDKKLFEKVGRYYSKYDCAQDFDLFLRMTYEAKKIVHIRRILYFWRACATSTASDVNAKPQASEAGRLAVSDSLTARGISAEVTAAEDFPTAYRVRYKVEGSPLVSIVIPNKDHVDDLKCCIDSIIKKTTYKNYEIVIVENNSTTDSVFKYYEELKKEKNIKVCTYKGDFNYSAINNYGVSEAGGDYYLLLNNDTEVISPDWIQEMLSFAQRPNTGAVGAKLLFNDGTIQHAGVSVGQDGIPRHFQAGMPNDSGYMGRLRYAQNVSAVTAACLMVRKDVYKAVNGLNAKYKVCMNDVDFCLRLMRAGYINVFTPFAELYHYESKTRGTDDSIEKMQRFNNELNMFKNEWKDFIDKGDPYCRTR